MPNHPGTRVDKFESTHFFTTHLTYRIVYPDTTQHVVHCRHSALGGRRKAFVNGALQFTDRHWLDTGSEHAFRFEQHDYVFVVAYSDDLFGYRYALRVDGHAVVPLSVDVVEPVADDAV